jgi:hypothetical protein
VALADRPHRVAAMWAIGLGAFGVEIKGVLANDEATFLGNPRLPAFDLGIVELLDTTTIDADEMVMVLSRAQFENRLARFEIMPLEQAGLLELGQHAVNGGQADIQIFGEQQAIDVLGSEMTNVGFLEKSEDLRRGRVAFSPMLLRSSELLIGLP